MISVGFSPQKETISFELQYPLPQELEKHPEWERLAGLLSGPGQALWRRDQEGQISGLSLGFSGWRDFLSAALTGQALKFQQDYFGRLLAAKPGKGLEGLEVNFHQKPFDTPYRFFSFYLNQGDFTAYFINRFNWDTGPKDRAVGDFPFHVDLETASTCNMNCPMCYRDMLEKTGRMSWELFTRAVDECAANQVYSLRLSWRGEALTHPRIKEMIAYATSRIPNVSFLTNAFYIDRDMAAWFIEKRVNYIAVSFDGIGKVYEAVRAPAKFQENHDRLKHLKQMREAAGASMPQVRLCTIWPAIRENPQAYYEAMKDVSDYMVTNPYMNYKGPMTVKQGFICQYPWERLVVSFDGEVQCCTGWEAGEIILGNLAQNSLAEMWAGEQMQRIRRLHEAGRRMEIPACAACRHGSAGDPEATMEQILGRGW